MIKQFIFQNGGGVNSPDYTLYITSTKSTNIIVVKDLETLGSYSYTAMSGNKYTWIIKLTEKQLGFTGSFPLLQVTITLGHGYVTNPKSVSIMRTTYVYNIDMDEVELRSCRISGTVTNSFGTAVSGASIKELRVSLDGDTIDTTTGTDGTYSWTGSLSVGEHTLNCSALGFTTESSSFTVTNDGLLIQRFTIDFTLKFSLIPTQGCILRCASPTKSTRLVITPSAIASEAYILGNCSPGTLFSATLSYNDIFKQGVECRIYDGYEQITYAYVTLPANGQIIYFTM